MNQVFVFMMLASLGASAEETILVLDLQSSGIDDAQTKVINNILGQSIARQKTHKVVTHSDVRRMLDVESEKEILGCDSDSNCLVDLGGDFGARYVVYGSVAALGEVYLVQLTLFDVQKTVAVARSRAETKSLSDIASNIDRAVDSLFGVDSPKVMPDVVAQDQLMPTLFLAGGTTLIVAGGLAMAAVYLPPFELANAPVKTEKRIGDLEALFVAEHNDDTLREAKSLQRQADGERLTADVTLALGAGVALVGAAVLSAGVAFMIGAE